jgi:hypothetical protein
MITLKRYLIWHDQSDKLNKRASFVVKYLVDREILHRYFSGIVKQKEEDRSAKI